MKFTINRSKWSTGSHGKGFTELLNDEDYMCCLGFVCMQSGCSQKDLLYVAEPEQLRANVPFFLVDEYNRNSQLTYDAIEINDDSLISDEERESKLIQLFAKHNIDIEFVGEYSFPEKNN